MSVNSCPPTRLYFHGSCFEGAYGNYKSAIRHFLHTVEENEDLFFRTDYLLSIMWGNSSKKMIDFFSYSGLDKKWKENPEVFSYVTENGIYLPEERNISCGDGLIILGEEENFRRFTKNLDDYLNRAPQIGGLIIIGNSAPRRIKAL